MVGNYYLKLVVAVSLSLPAALLKWQQLICHRLDALFGVAWHSRIKADCLAHRFGLLKNLEGNKNQHESLQNYECWFLLQNVGSFLVQTPHDLPKPKP